MSTEAEELQRRISMSVKDMLSAYRIQAAAGPVTDKALEEIVFRAAHDDPESRDVYTRSAGGAAAEPCAHAAGDVSGGSGGRWKTDRFDRGGHINMTGEPITRDRIFAMAAQKLRKDFEELSLVPHRGLKGDEASRLVRRFLDDHLPKRFATGSGFIIDKTDKISRQTDVAVYDALNCPVYRASEEAGIFPADNVAAVVEVKSRLDREKLYDAAENIAVAKGMAKTRQPETPFLVQTQTLGCVFAFESELTVETLAGHYSSLLREKGLGRHIDLILLLDRAVYTLAARLRGSPGWASCFWEGFGPLSEGSHLGCGALLLEGASLDGFLRLLLAHLTFFRGTVDHPGFGYPTKDMRVEYLMSHTEEKDPARRAETLRRYADEVKREFGSGSR